MKDLCVLFINLDVFLTSINLFGFYIGSLEFCRIISGKICSSQMTELSNILNQAIQISTIHDLVMIYGVVVQTII